MRLELKIHSDTHMQADFSIMSLPPRTDLEVTVHNAHVVEVFDGIQDLQNELTGVFLCVETLLYDTIEELPAGHPG